MCYNTIMKLKIYNILMSGGSLLFFVYYAFLTLIWLLCKVGIIKYEKIHDPKPTKTDKKTQTLKMQVK